MISLIEPLAVGNATRLIISPPPAAASWQVLRRTTDTISGPDDAGAVKAADWDRYEAVIDTDGLVNGVPVFYRVFYRDAAGAPILPHLPSVTETPAASSRDTSADPLLILRKRMEAGFAVAVAEGRIASRVGRVPIVVAPMMDPAKTTFPIISIHMDSDRPAEFGVGDDWPDDELTGIGTDETTGYLSEVVINLIGVSNNPDERITLGKVMKHIFLANREVFAAHGLIRPTFNLSHSEIVPENNAASLFIAAATFTCLAASTSTAAVASEITTATITMETHQ